MIGTVPFTFQVIDQYLRLACERTSGVRAYAFSVFLQDALRRVFNNNDWSLLRAVVPREVMIMFCVQPGVARLGSYQNAVFFQHSPVEELISSDYLHQFNS